MSADRPITVDGLTSGPSHYHSSRTRPELLEQRREGEHVWASYVVHVLADDTVKAILDDRQSVIMDAENVATIMVGCYVCEQPLTPWLFHRRCTGEPRQ